MNLKSIHNKIIIPENNCIFTLADYIMKEHDAQYNIL